MLFLNPIHLIISVAFSSSVTPCFFAISLNISTAASSVSYWPSHFPLESCTTVPNAGCVNPVSYTHLTLRSLILFLMLLSTFSVMVYSDCEYFISHKSDPDNGIFGSQIDMLIARKDQVINLCEMKYSQSEYTITEKVDRSIRNKISDLRVRCV